MLVLCYWHCTYLRQYVLLSTFQCKIIGPVTSSNAYLHTQQKLCPIFFFFGFLYLFGNYSSLTLMPVPPAICIDMVGMFFQRSYQVGT